MSYIGSWHKFDAGLISQILTQFRIYGKPIFLGKDVVSLLAGREKVYIPTPYFFVPKFSLLYAEGVSFAWISIVLKRTYRNYLHT